MKNILRKESGKVSKTMIFGIVFIVLTVLNAALNFLGYGDYFPSEEIQLIASAAAALVVMILRHLTEEPMK